MNRMEQQHRVEIQELQRMVSLSPAGPVLSPAQAGLYAYQTPSSQSLLPDNMNFDIVSRGLVSEEDWNSLYTL